MASTQPSLSLGFRPEKRSCLFNLKTNTMKATIIISSILLILALSCRRITIIDSSAEIISRSIDETLNDSALIYGTVFFGKDDEVPMSNANVWIEVSNLKTTSDIYGSFSLPVLPGTYTIKCLGNQYEERFTAVVKNITLSPNEKIEIRFYHGSMSE